MKKYYCFSLIIVVVLGLSSLSFGEFSLTPRMKVSEKYNDNVLLTQKDREDDFITTLSPGIYLEYTPNSYFDMNLDYGFNFRAYADHTELNDTNIRETQFGYLTAQVRPLSGVFVDIIDVYRRVGVDVREKTAPDNDITNMTDSNTFIISPYVEIRLTSTLLSRFGYSYINKWYKIDEGNDSDGNGAFASVIHQFPFGLTLSLNYDFLAYRTEFRNDYDRHSGIVLASFKAGPYLIIQGGYGKAYIDLHDLPEAQSNLWTIGADYKIAAFGDAALGINYYSSLSDAEIGFSNISKISKTGGFALDTEPFILKYRGSTGILDDKASVTSGIMRARRLDLTFNISNDEYEVTINPFYLRNEELETERQDKISAVHMGIRKFLTTNLRAFFGVILERMKFLPGDEKVRFYSLGSVIKYDVSRSISTSAGYRYSKRNSNIDSRGYLNNIVWLKAEVTF